MFLGVGGGGCSLQMVGMKKISIVVLASFHLGWAEER